jgi:hypothetical protein
MTTDTPLRHASAALLRKIIADYGALAMRFRQKCGHANSVGVRRSVAEGISPKRHNWIGPQLTTRRLPLRVRLGPRGASELGLLIP